MDGVWIKAETVKPVMVLVLMVMLFTGAVYAQDIPDIPDRGLPSHIILPEIWVQHADTSTGEPGFGVTKGRELSSTTGGSGDDYFNPGEAVYLGGHGFKKNKRYNFKVVDDGSGEVVKSGNVSTDVKGNIRVAQIWTIPQDDYAAGHRYRVEINNIRHCCVVVTQKDGPTEIPEFPTVAIPAILAVGGYLAIRMRRKMG